MTEVDRRALVIRNARIHPQCRPDEAQALAIVGRRVAAVGTDEVAWAAVGSDAPEIDLGGMSVVPGFTDAHLHWTNFALARRRAQLSPSLSLEQVLEVIRGYAEQVAGSHWILGRGWDHTAWGRWPQAVDLDRVVPDRPVVLTRKDGHAVWLNSAALAAIEIDDTTPDPPGGKIERHHGRATGILKENAVQLALAAIPEPGPAERQAAMADAWPEAWRCGITGCHDMGVLSGEPVFHDLAALREVGDLGLRFVWYLRSDDLDEAIGLGLSSRMGDPWLRVGGLKLFLDGTLGSLTAHMLDDFENEPGNRGIPTLDDETFLYLAGRAARAGLSSAVHCIGDAANRRALDGFQLLREEVTRPAIRQRIEHAQLLDPVDIPRFAELDVTASMQPIHATQDMHQADRHWGERCDRAYAWRSVLESGASLAFGSDAPIESISVVEGLHAAVTRTDASGRPPGGWYPNQSLTIEQALRAYTKGPAAASSQESDLGDLAAGKLADLVVLDRSPFGLPADELLQLNVMATMIDGEWVWKRSGAQFRSVQYRA